MGLRIDDWAGVREVATELLGPEASKADVELLAEQIGLATERGTIRVRWQKLQPRGNKFRTVFLAECIRLALDLEFAVSPYYQERLERANRLGEQVPNFSGTWPWGEHETEKLRHLKAAAIKWWANYDPSDKTTAPTNETVVAWLKDRGVAERTAKAMATILRADDIPDGPRK